MTQTLATPRGGAVPALRLPWWDRWFHLTERGSTLGREVGGGLATFLTMSYILFVNPSILGAVEDRSGVQLQFAEVLTVTALVGGVMSIAMGGIGRFPMAIASGMGLNAFVAFGLVAGRQLSWPEAMGVIVAEGVVIFVLVAVGLRQIIFDAIPVDLKRAIAVGIGAFIGVIGLVNANIIQAGEGTVVMMNSNLTTWNFLVFGVGLAIAAIGSALHFRGALLGAILGATVVATVINEAVDKPVWQNGIAAWPDSLTAAPKFGLVGNFSFNFIEVLGLATAAAVVLAVLLSDFFDTGGTVAGIGEKAGLADEKGRVQHLTPILLVDSAAAAAGGAASASSNTSYIESLAGVTAGARTGIASIVTGLAFLACLFLSPLAGMVPAEATAGVLVVVGANMLSLVSKMDWEDWTVRVSGFLTIMLIPFTYNIAHGIGAGFVSYTVMAVFIPERRRTLHPLMVAVSAVFVWYFAYGQYA